MKRKRIVVLVIALVVLCVLIGLGIALWYLFGSNPNDGGGNGDDTTTVTPGDPDDEPGTGGNPDDEPGTGGNPDDEPGTGGNPDDEPGTGGNPDDEPGTPENPDDEPGTGGNPDDEPGTGGNPDDEPGTGGNPDEEPGTGGNPDDEPGTGGNPDDEPGTPGDPDDEPGTGGNPDDEPGTGGNPDDEPGTPGNPDDEPGTGGNPDDEPGTGGNPDEEPGTGGNPDDEPGTGGNPDDEPGTGGDPDDEPETPHEHTYTSAVTKEPTCTQEGEMTYTCICGDSYTEPIAMIPHTEVIDEAVAPTCTATGLTEGKHCSVCGTVLVEQEVVPTIAHNYVGKETKEPTCTQTGVVTYTCACGDSYTASTAALGHLYRVTSRQEATCTQEGEVVYTCSRCDDSYTIRMNASHRYELVETVAATCTEAGYQLYRCSECEEEYRNTIPAGGGHDYVGVVTLAPTTEQEGEMTYTCSACGDSYTVPLAKLNSGSGHVLLIQDRLPWTTDNNAVILNYLTESGQIGGWEIETTQQAAALDLSAYGIIYIANDQTTATYDRLGQLNEKLTQFVQGGGVLIYGACDHGWAAGDISYALPGGVSVQNYYSNYNYIVNATHDIITGVLTGGEAITDRILYGTYSSHTTFHGLPAGADILLQDANGDPTLVEYTLGNGYVIASGLTWEYTYERTFVDDTSFAKEIYDDLFVYAQTLVSGCEHEYLAGETVAPTCTEDGYTVYTCTVCGRTYHGDYVTALGHTYTSEETKKPTCEQEGEMTYTCSVCGGSYTESIPMTAHTEVIDAAVAPTCTTTGLTEGKHCSVCGTVLVEQEVIPMTQHSYTSKVTKEPTCTEEGVRTYTCSGCGNSYTEKISANGHTIVIDEAVAPSCTKTGLTEGKHCSVCGTVLVKQEVVPMTQHTYTSKVTKEPTCTEEGVRTYTCSGCNNSYTEKITANGHTIVIDKAVAPTCTKTGLTEGKHCFVCDTVLVKQEVIPMTEHSYTSKVTKKPTCTEEGVRTYTCSGCNNSYTEKITANGHTIVIDEAVAPTCIKTGLTEGKHCSVCGTVLVKQEVIPMTEHSYTSKVTKKPTCTEEGVRTYTCSGCSSSYTEKISANGHSIVIDNAVEPTCTKTGLTQGSHCSACGETLVGQNTLPTIPHNYVDGVCTMCGKRVESDAMNGLVFILSNDGTYYSVTDYTGSAEDVYIPSVYKELPVTSIGESAFRDCSSLTSITIPNGVTSIGWDAFYNCSSLEGVYITDIAAWCAIEFNNLYSNPLYFAHNLYFNDQLVTELVIPDGVTNIGNYAFEGCSGLTSVTIPDSVTSIGDKAFSRCSKLTSIKIPDSVTSIGWDAFYNCSSLTSVTIGNGVTSIGSRAFSGCSSLTSITIPDSVTSIGHYAFNGCYRLTSITIGNGVTSIGESAFQGCSGLTSVTIPDSVTSIGNKAFSGCRSLTSVTIGNGVTSIGNNAFFNCYNLTSITIPDSVTSIGNSAFSDCDRLTRVTFVNKNGWWVSTSSTATGGASISSSALYSASTAARYLTSTYCNYYWKKS